MLFAHHLLADSEECKGKYVVILLLLSLLFLGISTSFFVLLSLLLFVKDCLEEIVNESP